MKKSTLLLSAFFVVALISCKDNDTTAPIIADAHATAEVAAGGELVIEAHFTDDVELGQAKIDIHDLFDGHDHGKVAARWSETRVVSLDGKDTEIEEVFIVDTNATAGPYHALVQCTDAEGNNADFMEVDFWVTRADAPQFSVTSPVGGTDFEVGDVISFIGTAMDDTGLEKLIVRIYEGGPEGEHDHAAGHDDPIYEEEVELSGNTMFDLSMLSPITIDAAWLEGESQMDFTIEVSGIDIDENIAHTEMHFQVH